MAKNKTSRVTLSSGNIFADLGLENPGEHLAKSDIAIAISEIIKERGLTQEEAGKILSLSQPNISNLVRGKLDKFTIDRLVRYLRRLDCDVVISFRRKSNSKKEASLKVKNELVVA